MLTTTEHAYDSWHTELDALSDVHGRGLTHTDEHELRLAFDLGLSPLEAYLWHVRDPELPDADIYIDA